VEQTVQRVLTSQYLFFLKDKIMMMKKPMPAKKMAMSKMSSKAEDKKEMMKMMKDKMSKAKKKPMSGYK
jgi:hypothetical protein